MGVLRPAPSVTAGYSTITESLDSGRQVIDLLENLGLVSPDARFVQIGCGFGRIEYHLAPRVAECIGVDISPSMIRRARRLVTASNVRFVEGDSLAAFGDGEMDVVTSFLVFQHLPRAKFRAYIVEAARVLRKGGTFVFQIMIDENGSAPDPPAHHPYLLRRYRRHDVGRLLDEAGFVDTRTEAWPDGGPDNGQEFDDVLFIATKPERDCL